MAHRHLRPDAAAAEIGEVIQRMPRIAKLILKLRQHHTHHSSAELSAQEVDDLMYLINTLRHGARRHG